MQPPTPDVPDDRPRDANATPDATTDASRTTDAMSSQPRETPADVTRTHPQLADTAQFRAAVRGDAPGPMHREQPDGGHAGSLGGWFGGPAAAGVRFDDAQDAHYRALYEGYAPGDRGFDAVRPAYQFGHRAAHNPEWAGRDFAAIEPDLRRAWDDDLRSRHAMEWDVARPYVRDAYGHARSEGSHARRDAGVIGSAGSAVDPIELERARAGESSIAYDSPGYVETRDLSTGPSDPRGDPGTAHDASARPTHASESERGTSDAHDHDAF